MTPWLKLTIGGERWTVHLVSPNSRSLVAKDRKRHTGRCDYNKCRIYLSKDLENDAFSDALLHEILHALLFVTGAEHVYEGDVHKDELLVSALAPALTAVLRDFGFQFPKKDSV